MGNCPSCNCQCKDKRLLGDTHNSKSSGVHLIEVGGISGSSGTLLILGTLGTLATLWFLWKRRRDRKIYKRDMGEICMELERLDVKPVAKDHLRAPAARGRLRQGRRHSWCSERDPTESLPPLFPAGSVVRIEDERRTYDELRAATKELKIETERARKRNTYEGYLEDPEFRKGA